MKRSLIFGLIGGLIGVFLISGPLARAQKALHLSIATGGTGGIYYPIGNGMGGLPGKGQGI